MNSIFTIRPFKIGSIWAFSDPELSIHNESFVGDVNQIIDAMLLRADLPASEPFTALFSASLFPGTHLNLSWDKFEHGGNWYFDRQSELMGWFCPVLCTFFGEPPDNIYCRAEK